MKKIILEDETFTSLDILSRNSDFRCVLEFGEDAALLKGENAKLKIRAMNCLLNIYINNISS